MGAGGGVPSHLLILGTLGFSRYSTRLVSYRLSPEIEMSVRCVHAFYPRKVSLSLRQGVHGEEHEALVHRCVYVNNALGSA